MTIQTISLSCPGCGASLKVSSDRESFFCEYCGQKIYVSDSNHQKCTYRKVDDARIREADVQEAIRLRKMQDESRQKKFALYAKFGVLAACLLIIVMLIFLMVLPIDEDIKGACIILAVIMIIVVAVIIPKLFRNK